MKRHQMVPDRRKHAALLFNTPHYRRGFTSWIVLNASVLNISAPVKTHSKKWEPYAARLEEFDSMQRCFDRITKEIIRVPIWAFYASDPLPKSDLFE
jgi:hypothetical protein